MNRKIALAILATLMLYLGDHAPPPHGVPYYFLAGGIAFWVLIRIYMDWEKF